MSLLGKSKPELLAENKLLKKQIEKLKQQKEKPGFIKDNKVYLQAIENSQITIVITDVNGKIEYVNPYFTKLTGFSKDEAIGSTPRILKSGFHPESFYKNLWETINAGNIWSGEFLNKKKNGQLYWESANIGPIKNKEGKIINFVATKVDITEKKRAENLLKESETKFEILAEQSPNMIFINQKGRVVYANKKCEEIMGYTKEEFYSPDFDFRKLISPEHLNLINKGYEKYIRGEEAEPKEYAIVTKNGRRIDVLHSTKIINYGEDTALLGIITDITERKKSEEKIRESEARYRAVVEQSEDCIFLTDVESKKILEANYAMQNLLGYSSEEITNLFLYDIVAHDKDSVDKNIEQVIKDGYKFIGEREYLRKDGSKVEVEVNVSLISYRNKQVMSVVSRDITERKKVENALKQNEEKLRNIVEYSTNLFYSHTAQHVLTYVSPQSTRFLGCEPDEAMIKWTEFVTDNPVNKKGFEYTQKAIETGKAQPPYNLELKTKDGRIIWVEVNEAPVVKQGKTIAIVGALTDITNSKLAEDALRETESKFRSLVEQSITGIYIIQEGLFKYVNPKFAQIFGYEIKEIINRLPFQQLVIDEDRELVEGNIRKRIDGAVKTMQYTFRGRKKDGNIIVVEVHGSRSEYNGKPALIGTLLDITERVNKQKILQESERKLNTIINNLPGMAYRCLNDEVFTMKFLSNGCEELTGYLSEEIVENKKISFKEIIHKDDYENVLKDAAKFIDVEKQFELSYRIVTKQGKIKWVWERGIQVVDETTKEIFLEGIIEDVTEKKVAEIELIKSEELFRTLAKVAPVGIFKSDETGYCTYANKKVLEISGLSEIEALGKGWLQAIHPDDKNYVQKSWERAVKNRSPFSENFRIKRKDGSLSWVIGETHPIISLDGEIQGHVGIITDITQIKESELALQQSKERLTLAQEFGKVGSWDWDIVNDKLTWSDEAFLQFGLNPSHLEPTQELFNSLIHPDDRQKVNNAIERTFKYGEPYSHDVKMLRADGSEWYMHTQGKVIKDENGNPVRFVGVQQDITERKLMEDELNERKKTYQSLFEISPIGIAVHTDNNIVIANPEAVKILGAKKEEELIGKNIYGFIHPDDLQAIKNRVARVYKGEKNLELVEYKFITLDGKTIDVEISSAPVDYRGKPASQVVFRDISERKKAEEALLKSEQRYKHLFENSPVSLWEEDFTELAKYLQSLKTAGVANIRNYFDENPEELINCAKMIRIIDVNKSSLALHNAKSKNELISGLDKTFTVDSYNTFKEQLLAIAENKDHVKLDGTVKTIDGINKYVTVDSYLEKFIDEEGYTHNTALIALSDITERKLAEEALKKSESKWRSLTENSPDIITLTDLEGRIQYINRTEPDIDKKDLIGTTAFHIIPKEYQEGAEKCFFNVIQTGIPESYTTLYQTKEGKSKFYEVLVGPIYHEGKITGAISNSRDITLQKMAERKLRESHQRLRNLAERLQIIREEERATVAREIHDDLGQSLTALKMDLTWLKKNLVADKPDVLIRVESMLDLTNASIQTVKKIATELRPGVLDDLGLISAIEWQLEEFQKRTNIKCNLQLNRRDLAVADETSVGLFRVFQEALTNITRHSGAANVNVIINFSDNDIKMEIKDNGRGITKEEVSSPSSLGLLGMRERITILGGALDVNGYPGKGTSVIVTLPLKRDYNK